MDNENSVGHNRLDLAGHVLTEQRRESLRQRYLDSVGRDEKAGKQRGLFIVFEGGEGSGKTTQAKKLAEMLDQLLIPTVLTKEPGGTLFGGGIRKMLLEPQRSFSSKKAEALLFAADRAEHHEAVIKPALGRGEVVICDRYIASSVAYQAYAGGLDPEDVYQTSEWAVDGLMPDLTIYLDIPPEKGLARASKTHFENKGLPYHQDVHRGFMRQINDNSWWVIDAQQSPDKVHERIAEIVMTKYENHFGVPAQRKSFLEKIQKLERKAELHLGDMMMVKQQLVDFEEHHPSVELKGIIKHLDTLKDQYLDPAPRKPLTACPTCGGALSPSLVYPNIIHMCGDYPEHGFLYMVKGPSQYTWHQGLYDRRGML